MRTRNIPALAAFCAITALPAFFSHASADVLVGRAIQVSDGDTLRVASAGNPRGTSVRLRGIDAPELGQPYGKAAKRRLQALCVHGNAQVRVSITGTDRFGRSLGIVSCGATKDVNALLVQEGLAWAYAPRRSDSSPYTTYQIAAQRNRVGLWQQSHPMPPHEWRAQNR